MGQAHTKPLIIIPSRMRSMRLPGKPLADIGGVPMIVRVLRQSEAASLGPVYVACSEPEVFDAVTAAGGKAVMTDPDLPSGTDRVKAAADSIDPDCEHDLIINVQGDMPLMQPGIVTAVYQALVSSGADMATLAVETDDPREIADPNVVKAICAKTGRALYFTRAAAPSGDGSVLHHVGIYAYTRAALGRFCQLPPSPLEQRERLEQLRALEDGMHIQIAIVDTAPDGVDTPDDLERARRALHTQENQL